MSRVVLLPKKLWSDSCAIASLAPGEVRELRVKTDTPVPEGHTMSLTASCGDASAVVASGTPTTPMEAAGIRDLVTLNRTVAGAE
jgi:hypothetical protein